MLRIQSTTDPSKQLDVNVDELFQEMLSNYGSTPTAACQTWILIDHARNTNYLSSAVQRKYQVTWPTPVDLRPLMEWFDQQCNGRTAPAPTTMPPAPNSGPNRGPGPSPAPGPRPQVPTPQPNPMPVLTPTPPTPATTPTPPARTFWDEAKVPAMVAAAAFAAYWLAKHSQ
jgi:hypothetical protein